MLDGQNGTLDFSSILCLWYHIHTTSVSLIAVAASKTVACSGTEVESEFFGGFCDLEQSLLLLPG